MKGLLAGLVIVGAAVAVDNTYNSGEYTSAALSMLREIQRAFGF
jgi:hypothetical protein